MPAAISESHSGESLASLDAGLHFKYDVKANKEG